MDWSSLDAVERSAVMNVIWRAAESKRSDRLFTDEVAERAAAMLPPWPASAAAQVFADLVALRSAQLDEEVARALHSGLDQIVVLGAGLDTRFWRIFVPANALLIEMDSEAVTDLALQILPNGGRGHRVASRIPGGVAQALDSAGHDALRPTLWIAEGVVEYLPGNSWSRLVDVMTARSAPGCRALITILGDELPSRFGHDPTFPFPRLPKVAELAAAASGAWRVDLVAGRGLRDVPPDAYAIMSMHRSAAPRGNESRADRDRD